MSGEQFCATHELDGEFRRCYERGRHYVTCESATCYGCIPRQARFGLLCDKCWERVQDAFFEWSPFYIDTILRLERAVQRDNNGIRSSPDGYIPLPGTKLAVDEIRSYLSTLGDTDVLTWVSKAHGAINALRFAKAVPAAKRTYEIEERETKLRRVRCPSCRQLSFFRIPPGAPLEPVRVSCQTEGCGKTIREGDTDSHGNDKISVIANIEGAAKASPRILDQGGAPVNQRGDFAAPYDPDRDTDLDVLSTVPLPELRTIATALEVKAARSLRKSDLIRAIRETQEATA